MSEAYSFNPGKRSVLSFFSVTSILIALNIFAFILFFIALFFFRDNPQILYDYVSLKPANIVEGKYFWTFLTSMFMHAGFAHLFFNMISLFFIGSFVERIIGRKRYLWFYMISGLVAGVFFVFLAYFFGNNDLGARIFGNPLEAGVGASGAIFGLAGLLAVLIPRKKVYLIAGPLIAIIAQAILSNIYSSSYAFGMLNTFVTFYIFFSIFSMFSPNPKIRRISLPLEMPFWLLPFVAILPLVLIGLFVSLPIANTAHFGGLIVGLAYGFYLRNKYKKKTKLISRHFS